MKSQALIPAALLALAACQQNTDNIAIDEANNVAAVEVETLPPNDGTAAAQGTPAATPTNAASPAKLPTAIPAQFHGRWGLTKADCTSTKGDAKGLLIINDVRLTFYEAKGTLDKVLGATKTSFDANYGFSGEGQTWQRVERFKLVNASLNRRTDAAAGQEPPVNLTYKRCAN
ncbi:hypothetical protein [Sphingomonas sp.]|uniref:hypothetical protein n=1 Tax=Sphingomonas sp. TaxID=28214 RepID=UPI00286AD9B1|nr:hypothetical protein [Sphingomonas sp.]